MNRHNRAFIIPLALLLSIQCSTLSEGDFAGTSFESTFHGALTIMKASPKTRFAVLDFTDSAGSFTAYGKVIGDETFYRLSSLKGINLIERQRLASILEEHQLQQSGLISGKTKELGQILPVDIIVVGSYIFDGDRIKVNGRFTDIKTGEIRGTFVYYLNSPYGRGKVIDIPDEPSSCEPYERMIEPVMRDLRTSGMIENAVKTAIQIPYSMRCHKIHRRIMSIFKRGGIYPEPYKQFLHDTVISIKNPEEIERKTAVFYYFQSDKKIDEMEWNTGILSMRNANERIIRRVVYFILNRGESQDENVLYKRIDILMGLTENGAFGKPRTLIPEKMFQTIFRTGPPNETTRNIRLYLLEKYAYLLAKDNRYLSLILTYSEKTLVYEKDPIVRARLYNHIGKIFSATEPEEKNSLALQLVRFTYEMHRRYGKTDKAELSRLSLALSPWFCYAATQTRRDYRLRSAVRILQAYRIKCDR